MMSIFVSGPCLACCFGLTLAMKWIVTSVPADVSEELTNQPYEHLRDTASRD